MQALSKLATQLLAVPSAKLAKRSGEDPRRVAILPPGLLIIALVLEHYELTSVTVVPEGVREGMILAVSSIGDDWWHDQPDPAPTPSAVHGNAARISRPSSATAARPRQAGPTT
jgi:exopolyphosphatase/pppGpp-phosphohydrolase